jgi:hypothetical protein
LNDVAEGSINESDIAPRESLKIASFWLGCLSLVATVTIIDDAMTGAMASVVSVFAMSFAVIGSSTWRDRRCWPHVIAAALAALSVFGVCAERCGTYAFYENFLGLLTGIAAILLHGIIALTLVVQTRRYPDKEFVADIAVAVGVGGSLFYGGVLVASGIWCGMCFAIHALMLVQMLELLLNKRGVQRFAALVSAIAAAGAVNLVYHHRPLPPIRSDAAELLTYMRSLWTADAPPQRLMPISEQLSDAAHATAENTVHASHATAEASLWSVAEGSPLATPVKSASNSTKPVEASRALRTAGDANRWGSSDAPVAVAYGTDLGCPVCAQQFSQLLELRDLVERGKIQVRFLLSYKNDAAQAMASLSYAAGLSGDKELIDTLIAFYAHQHEILTAADAVQHLPASFPRQRAIATVRSHQDDITALMTDAAKLKETLGGTGDPVIWFFESGGAIPHKAAREFKGLTLSPMLRLAANSLAAP